MIFILLLALTFAIISTEKIPEVDGIQRGNSDETLKKSVDKQKEEVTTPKIDAESLGKQIKGDGQVHKLTTENSKEQVFNNHRHVSDPFGHCWALEQIFEILPQKSNRDYHTANQFDISNQISPQNLLGKIHQNLSLINFEKFQLIYNEKFSTFISQQGFKNLFYKITRLGDDPLVCVAAENQKILVLVACDYFTQAFSTTLNVYGAQCSHPSEICWYFYPGRAFGFSPISKIDLTYCDKFNPEDTKRLCISIHQEYYERRIGILNQPEQIKAYNLQIYILKI